MTPLRIPRDTPGFDPWRGRTPQPVDAKAWAKLIGRIIKEWWKSRTTRKGA